MFRSSHGSGTGGSSSGLELRYGEIAEWLRPAGVQPADRDFEAADAAARRILDWLAAHPDVTALTALDEAYPHKLRDLGPDQPPVLYVRHEAAANLLAADCTAVIGSRWPEERTFRECPGLVESLVRETGTVIVSGLARGCDAIGHRAAMAAGGITGAVLASGIDIITPAMHEELAADILRTGGFLISEYDPGTEPAEYRYVERDRLTAALSDRLLVLECGIRSGTMQTVKAGAALGRPLACVHPADGSEPAEGNRYMNERYHAAVIRSREEVCRWKASAGRPAGRGIPETEQLSLF